MHSKQRLLRTEHAYYEAVRNMTREQRERTKQPLHADDRHIPLMRTARARWLRLQRLHDRLTRECQQSGVVLNGDGSLAHHP